MLLNPIKPPDTKLNTTTTNGGTMTFSREETTDTELDALFVQITEEQQRRWRIGQTPEIMRELNREYLLDVGRKEGVIWQQPEGLHDAYPKDYCVARGDELYLSFVDANVFPLDDAAAWGKMNPEE